MLQANTSPSSSYPHVRDSDYETTSSNIDPQRFRSPTSPSPDGQFINVTYPDASLSTSNTISRTLRTFSYLPTRNGSGNESSTRIIARLAEQEVIEV